MNLSEVKKSTPARLRASTAVTASRCRERQTSSGTMAARVSSPPREKVKRMVTVHRTAMTAAVIRRTFSFSTMKMPTRSGRIMLSARAKALLSDMKPPGPS